MSYNAEDYVPVELLKDLEQRDNKVYRFDEDLKQELLSDISYKKAASIHLSPLAIGVPLDSYLHIESTFDFGLGKSVDGFFIRDINLKFAEDETVCIELLFLQGDKFIRYYRMPVEQAITLKDVIDTNKFKSKIETYYEDSKDLEKSVEIEKMNIIKAFVLVDYTLDKYTDISEVNSKTERVEDKVIITFYKE